MPTLRALAARVGKDHGHAMELWDSGIHEARLLATMVGPLSNNPKGIRMNHRWDT